MSVLLTLAVLSGACGHRAAAPPATPATAAVAKDAPQPAPPPDPRRDARKRWPTNCRDLKRALDPTLANRRARKLPPRGPSDPWALRIGERSASLPAERYAISVNLSPRSLSVILVSSSLSVVLIEDPPSSPMADLFARLGEQRNTASEQFTRELFGKAPTEYDLLRVGYAYTLDDLTCDPARLNAEVPIAIGLVLKTTGSWAEEAYDEPFGESGFTFTGRQGRHCVVETQLFSAKANHIVSYRATRPELCRERLKRFSLSTPRESRGPRWLALLGAALAQPHEVSRWRALRDELAKTRAPAASIASVDRVIGQLGGGKR